MHIILMYNIPTYYLLRYIYVVVLCDVVKFIVLIGPVILYKCRNNYLINLSFINLIIFII